MATLRLLMQAGRRGLTTHGQTKRRVILPAPLRPHSGAGGQALFVRPKDHSWQQIEDDLLPACWQKATPPRSMLDQGRKLALLVDFHQQALFPEPLSAHPEIGEEHLTRLA